MLQLGIQTQQITYQKELLEWGGVSVWLPCCGLGQEMCRVWSVKRGEGVDVGVGVSCLCLAGKVFL